MDRTVTLLKGKPVAVAILVAVGAILRLYNLEGYPTGIHGDETGFGLIADSILQGNGPNPFGTAFLGDPALFLYMEAPFLAIFGHTIAALRLFSALCGVLTLPAFYWLMRRLFGVRPALLALALLAGSAVHINFSRLALNVAQVPLLTCLTLYALWRGQESRRAFWWLAAGTAGAFAVYFHFGGRLLPLLVGLYILYLLVTQPRAWRSWLRGAAFSLLGGTMTLAPMGAHLATRSHFLTEHVSGRLIWNHWSRVSQVYGTTDLWGILWGQIRVNVMAFINGVDASTFYTFTGLPMLAPLLGPFLVLGLVLMLVRLRDSRYAMLALWFWTVVILGGALTIDSPQAHRLVPAVLPAVAGIALVLDRIVAVGRRLSGEGLEPALLVLAALVPLAAGYTDSTVFFGRGADARPWEATTLQGRYVASLGPEYRVYTMGTPNIYFDHSVTRFLAPDVEGGSLHNPVALLPMSVPADRNLAFLVYPHMAGYLPLLNSIYPEGKTENVQGRDNRTIFVAFRVPRGAIGARQGLTARYAGIERLEADTAFLGGGAATYPAWVNWSGSICVERAGRYILRVDGGPSSLKVDGVAIGPGEERQLSVGWHQLELRGNLETPASRLSMKWRPQGQQLAPVPTRDLDARSLAGSLRCRIVARSGATEERLDRAIGFRNLAELWSLREPTTATWDGALDVQVPGLYGISVNSTDAAEVDIDGRRVVAIPEATSALRSAAATLELSSGSHPITVRYSSSGSPNTLELLWTPPGARQTIIPPEAFGSSHLIQ